MASLEQLYRVLDGLVERFATQAPPATVQAARKEFEARRGRVFEDEELWDMASTTFVECYVLEEPDSGRRPAPATAALFDAGDDHPLVLAWLRSLRSLFRIEDLGETHVDLVDLVGGAPFRVAEPRSFKGVARGDVLEARLVGSGDEVYFGRGFVFHPPGTGSAIAGHVDDILAAGGSRRDAVNFCASVRVRCERYQHVTPQRVYETASRDPAGHGVESAEPEASAGGPGNDGSA